MSKNIERILEEPSNKDETNRLSDEADGYSEQKKWGNISERYIGVSATKGTFNEKKIYKALLENKEEDVRKQIELLKTIDHTEALALNEEFDRLAENTQEKARELQKAQEGLQKAQEEFEEFSKRLNAKVETKTE